MNSHMINTFYLYNTITKKVCIEYNKTFIALENWLDEHSEMQLISENTYWKKIYE